MTTPRPPNAPMGYPPRAPCRMRRDRESPVVLLRASIGEPESRDHFVEDEQHVVLGADGAQSLQETLLRGGASLQGLDDDGGEVARVLGDDPLREGGVVVGSGQDVVDRRRWNAGARRVGPREIENACRNSTSPLAPGVAPMTARYSSDSGSQLKSPIRIAPDGLGGGDSPQDQSTPFPPMPRPVEISSKISFAPWVSHNARTRSQNQCGDTCGVDRTGSAMSAAMSSSASQVVNASIRLFLNAFSNRASVTTSR